MPNPFGRAGREVSDIIMLGGSAVMGIKIHHDRFLSRSHYHYRNGYMKDIRKLLDMRILHRLILRQGVLHPASPLLVGKACTQIARVSEFRRMHDGVHGVEETVICASEREMFSGSCLLPAGPSLCRVCMHRPCDESAFPYKIILCRQDILRYHDLHIVYHAQEILPEGISVAREGSVFTLTIVPQRHQLMGCPKSYAIDDVIAL